MKHLFVPYEIAKKLKEKGFDEPCLMGFYQITGIGVVLIEHYKVDDKDILMCDAPLYQQAVDWFREKHNLILSYCRDGGYYFFTIQDLYDEDDQGAIDTGQGASDSEYYIAFTNTIIEALKLT